MENNEIILQNQAPNMPNIRAGMMPQFNDINQGTVAIEASRAIAEAQGKLVIAKRFPRDEVEAYAKAMPFYEQAQKLAPQNTALWGNPLLRIYYDLNKATEYDILSKELGY
mgnify:CR=1 FL=1